MDNNYKRYNFLPKISSFINIKKHLKEVIAMKVAAYARVSTGSEEQYTSFKNQLSYFTEKIISEGNELIKLYSDEGLTGTNFKRKGYANKYFIVFHLFI